MSKQIENLNNLKEFEVARMETPFGLILVQRTDGDNGAGAACIMVEDFPMRARSVKCNSPREAFERQLEVLKAYFQSDAQIIETAQAAKIEYAPHPAMVATAAAVAEGKCFWCHDSNIEGESGEFIACAFCGRETKPTVAELRAKITSIASRVASVEVAFEEEFDNLRFYTAITRDTNVPHIYTVRVEENFEDGRTQLVAFCPCAAKTKCRHIRAVLTFDAERTRAARFVQPRPARHAAMLERRAA